MERRGRAWILFLATRLVGFAADAAVLALAYLAAFALRFDFQAPMWGWRKTALSFITVCIVHLLALVVTGCYRLAWRRIRGSELPRYIGAMLLACLALTVLRCLMPNVALAHIRPPYSITLIFFFLGTIGIVGVRVLWRVYWTSRLKDEALLERDVRRFDSAVAAKFLAGRVVMVTGAGGSIGGEIVRQVAAAGAARVLMVERSENALYEIHRALHDPRCIPLMDDVNDRARMAALLAAEKPSVILHAAAYKHVPMVEMNPAEGWRNNTEATRQLAELAEAHGVQRFVLISTDKAVNPVSVMGRTKLAAEQAIMALNARRAPDGDSAAPGATSFCAVRFGNVFGSSGSVVPLFREQIAHRRPVTVTHPEMKRYFMTIQEAVALVLQAAARAERAIYTLDMGEPIRILDLAERMIEQAGYRPYVDIPIVFTGVRPGEKLFEEIDVSERSCFKTDMAKIYITK
ncbi:MAG: SDR family NAD(P)-dependent oxidoreductase [Kiritimatiellia bacterium]